MSASRANGRRRQRLAGAKKGAPESRTTRKPPVRFGPEGEAGIPTLAVRARFDLIHSASLLVLPPEFAVVLVVEQLGRKHERPIVRMERHDLARGVEDGPGRAGLVVEDPCLTNAPQ